MENEWIIIHRNPNTGNLGLLQVGEKHYPSSSIRKNLSRTARHTLQKPLELAAVAGEGLQDSTQLENTAWNIVVTPIVTPYSRTPIGAMGIYFHDGAVLPQKPIVGALEWNLTRAETIYWNDSLLTIYGLNQNEVPFEVKNGHKYWTPTRETINARINLNDQNILQKLISSAKETKFSDVVRINYTVANSTSHGELVELVAGVRTAPSGEETFFGMLRTVNRHNTPNIPKELPKPQPIEDALLAITNDLPIIHVHIFTLQIVQVFPGWRNFGLPDVDKGNLKDVFHSDVFETIQNKIQDLGHGNDVFYITDLDTRMADGTQTRCDLKCSNIDGEYILMRMIRSNHQPLSNM